MCQAPLPDPSERILQRLAQQGKRGHGTFSGVGVGEYTAMECGKVHGLGELLEERGVWRGGSLSSFQRGVGRHLCKFWRGFVQAWEK